jgi:hypothetical protein
MLPREQRAVPEAELPELPELPVQEREAELPERGFAHGEVAAAKD